MSDSLNATVIVSVLALTISANVVELEDDDEDDEPPRLPALVDAALLEPDDDELPELEDAVDPEDTESPGERLSNETIVPLVGARSHVCASAILALATLSSALYTDAWADAMLDADDVVLVEAAPLEPEGAPLEPEAPLEPPDAAVGADGVVVLGVVVVGVVVGVVVVGVVVVVLGVVVVGVVVVEGVVGVVEGVVGEVEVEVVEVVAVLAVVSVNLVVSDTNSVEPELVFSRLVLVDDELLFALLS